MECATNKCQKQSYNFENNAKNGKACKTFEDEIMENVDRQYQNIFIFAYIFFVYIFIFFIVQPLPNI